MILAAGLGTRLRPLTDDRPKALVEVRGVPLLEILIRKLLKQGIQSFSINVHHFPDQIKDFLYRNHDFGAKITISDERELLLDSGGGILKASVDFPKDEDILVHNVDVLTNLDIRKMHSFHREHAARVTLAVRDRLTARYFLFNEDNKLCGWRNTKDDLEFLIKGHENQPLHPLAFSGISILSPDFIGAVKSEGRFPIKDELLRQAASSPILAYPHDQDTWIDVGRPEQLEEATKKSITLW